MTKYFEIRGGPQDGGSFGVDMDSDGAPTEIFWRRGSDEKVAVHVRKKVGDKWVYVFDGWNTTKELGHEHFEDH